MHTGENFYGKKDIQFLGTYVSGDTEGMSLIDQSFDHLISQRSNQIFLIFNVNYKIKINHCSTFVATHKTRHFVKW